MDGEPRIGVNCPGQTRRSKIERAFTNILSQDVNKAALFYQGLLGMTRHFDSDWFVVLTHADINDYELGILDRQNELVPGAARAAPQGVFLTFVVKDVEAVFAKATAMGATILEPPTDMAYGQRRLLLRDVDGTVVDISAPTAPLA